MTGDYTKVPLRPSERWTGARMQQGRVLLDHEWNLNLDAAAGGLQAAAAAVIGAAGVPRRSSAFQVAFADGNLVVQAGRMWVDGLMAVAPADFTYGGQPGIAPLPATGRVLVFLDVFAEHVQPAEDSSLIEPALSPVDSAARTRVGYRVRFAPTTALTCQAAWKELVTVARSTGRLSVERVAGAGPTDPCAPPADDLSLLPDGLLRIEVLDPGTEATARFVWSYENGAAALPVVGSIAGSDVTVASSPAVRFSTGDLVEVSWLARRADRIAHADGAGLYTVGPVASVPAGDRLTLDRPIAPPPAGAEGVVVRRWDGQAQGAATARTAALRGLDLVRFTAADGDYQAGDWWGVRLRDAGQGVEALTTAEPDGIRHAFAPLALADLATRTVEDCRPTFRSLVDVGEGTCTLTLRPGDDLQLALEELPPTGGEVCLRAGEYVLEQPLRLTALRRVVLHGAGPATVLRALGSEAAIVFEGCDEVEVRGLRAQGAVRAGTGDLDGALTFVGCTDVLVHDCALTCADGADRAQACVTARASDRVRVERCRLEVGARQVGALIVDAGSCRLSGNHVRLALTTGGGSAPAPRFVGQGIVVGGTRADTVQVLDNVVEDAVQGIHVGVSDASSPQRELAGEVVVLGNVVHLLVPADYDRERHAVFVGNARSVQLKDTVASLTRAGAGTPTMVEAIRVFGQLGPFVVVRQTSLSGFPVGVSVSPLEPIPDPRVWLVAETMAAGGVLAVDAPPSVDSDEHNAPMPAPPAVAAVTLDVAAVGGGAAVRGEVRLTAPARTGGVVVALSSSNANAVTVPAAVTIPAGAIAGAFTATTRSVPADANVTITALFADVTRTVALLVRAAVTAGAVTLSPPTLVGGAGNATGTVTLTGDAPAGGAAVALSSANPPIASPATPAVTVPAGQRSANFVVTTRTVQANIAVPINAAFGGVTRTAALGVLTAPVLKIGRIRLLAGGSELFDSAVDTGFLPSRRIFLTTFATFLGNVAILVDFANAPVDPASVTASTFQLARSGGGAPVGPSIVSPGGNAIQWQATRLPVGLWTVTLTDAIRSTNGRRLDGELTQFPTGNNVEGGSTEFTIQITRERLPLPDDEFDPRGPVVRP